MQHLEQGSSATQEFNGLLQQIRQLEREVGTDSVFRRAFAFQDELLPSIGEWSADRRRKLRNQAFLANLEIEKRRPKPTREDSFSFDPVAIIKDVGGTSIGMVI